MAEFETDLENILGTERQDKRCIELIAEIKSNCGKDWYKLGKEVELKKDTKYGFVRGMSGNQLTFGIGTYVQSYQEPSRNNQMNVRVLVDAHDTVYKITKSGIEKVTDSDENAVYETDIIGDYSQLPLMDLEKTKELRERCEKLYEEMEGIRHGLKKQGTW
jgi:hypothetical protein